MDQQPHDLIPPVNMPRPETEMGAGFSAPELNRLEGATELTTARAIEAKGQGSAAPMAPPLVNGPQVSNIPQIPANYVPPQTVSGPYAGAPQIADDNDLIEKEWVERAKEIVAQTRHDPHLQNKEVNKMKADYMKKRYNKDLKITQD